MKKTVRLSIKGSRKQQHGGGPERKLIVVKSTVPQSQVYKQKMTDYSLISTAEAGIATLM